MWDSGCNVYTIWLTVSENLSFAGNRKSVSLLLWVITTALMCFWETDKDMTVKSSLQLSDGHYTTSGTSNVISTLQIQERLTFHWVCLLENNNWFSVCTLFGSLVGNWSGENCEFFQKTRRSGRSGQKLGSPVEETGSSVYRQVRFAYLCVVMQTEVEQSTLWLSFPWILSLFLQRSETKETISC